MIAEYRGKRNRLDDGSQSNAKMLPNQLRWTRQLPTVSVLHVDDEEDFVEIIRPIVLGMEGFRYRHLRSVDEIQDTLKKLGPPAIVIFDLRYESSYTEFGTADWIIRNAVGLRDLQCEIMVLSGWLSYLSQDQLEVRAQLNSDFIFEKGELDVEDFEESLSVLRMMLLARQSPEDAYNTHGTANGSICEISSILHVDSAQHESIILEEGREYRLTVSLRSSRELNNYESLIGHQIMCYVFCPENSIQPTEQPLWIPPPLAETSAGFSLLIEADREFSSVSIDVLFFDENHLLEHHSYPIQIR